MKVVVSIPCLNEEQTLPLVLSSIPKEIPGADSVEILIVDDGSTDRTVEVARALGVHHVVRFKRNRGLARAFEAGLNAALELGADIIVTTDGDNQYPSEDIPLLIEPICRGEADIVIGDRQTDTIEHFSSIKKLLQSLGSKSVSLASGVKVADAVSGFRAYSREAAISLNMVTNFSYTTEVIIQAAKKGLNIVTVPTHTNPKTRESRLFGSTWEHVRRSGATIVRTYAMYQPLKVFFYLGAAILLLGFGLGFRFVYFMLIGDSSGHLQSLLLAAVLTIVGFQVFLIGLVADLVGINRKLLEDVLYLAKRSQFDSDAELDQSQVGPVSTLTQRQDDDITSAVELVHETTNASPS